MIIYAKVKKINKLEIFIQTIVQTIDRLKPVKRKMYQVVSVFTFY